MNMKHFNNILCVVEPDDSSEVAIIQAAALAKSHQAKLTVVSVVKKADWWAPFLGERKELDKTFHEAIQSKRGAVGGLVKKHCQGMAVSVDILIGIKFIQVILDVIKNKRDLVVKCCDDVAWLHRLFGSDDMHLLRQCPCPVLMLKPGRCEPFRNVLATVDVTDNEFDEQTQTENRVQAQLNQLVLEHASVFAVAESSDLHIGSVWDAYGESFLRYGAFSHMPDEKVDKYVEQTRREYSDKLEHLIRGMRSVVGKDAMDYISPKVHLVKGLASKEIPRMAKSYSIDLIVMGTVARTGVPGLIIGNTAEEILEQVQCSVLAIKPEGFKTPVQV